MKVTSGAVSMSFGVRLMGPGPSEGPLASSFFSSFFSSSFFASEDSSFGSSFFASSPFESLLAASLEEDASSAGGWEPPHAASDRAENTRMAERNESGAMGIVNLRGRMTAGTTALSAHKTG